MRNHALTIAVWMLFCAIISTGANATASAPSLSVKVMRVPGGGIQPQVAVSESGMIHIVFFKGDPRSGDLYYTKSKDGGASFLSPIRVNSEPGTALAIGSVRGSQLAIGMDDRVHIAWNGAIIKKTSDAGEPVHQKAAQHESPFFYARLNDEGSAFEAQRNLMQKTTGLDGGGAIAADSKGKVYAVWHGGEEGNDGEKDRKVWLSTSEDDGKTFAAEHVIPTRNEGACACCGVGAFVGKDDALYMLYRTAHKVMNRDIHLLISKDGGATAQEFELAEWNAGQCVMSTSAFAQGSNGVVAAWETKERVYFAFVNSTARQSFAPKAPPAQGNNSKHPALAVNDHGQFIMAWTSGTAWGKGGKVAYQVFDDKGQPMTEAAGTVDDLPVWGLVAAYAMPDGNFVIVY